MEKLSLTEFRGLIDKDEGLKSKRNILVIVSIVLIALSSSGAVLEEANTFIFKIKFTNHVGLDYFFALSIFFLSLRYYTYAQTYQEKLFCLWSDRMLSDYKVFSYNPSSGELGGLLSKGISEWPGDEPGIQRPSYKVSGLFSRNLTYPSTGYDHEEGEYFYDKNLELNRFNKDWTRRKYFRLLSYEIKYQVQALIKYREYLDLLAPYLISALALVSLLLKDNFILWVQSTT
jgi:hypothetical protein